MRTQHNDDRDPIERLAEKFLAEMRDGKDTSIEDFQRRFPNHAESIKALFPTLLMMEDLKPEMRRVRDSADTLLDRNVSQLGDFRIIRKIGFGGMGIVYEAQQESLDRPVAIKVFAPTLLSSARQIRRFKREAKAAGTLHHSNIVPILGVGEQWGIHYYIMQLIDGQALNQVISQCGDQLREKSHYPIRGNWRVIARLGQEVASALSYAHGRKILHRDIKPANLLIDQEGTTWIADFGLAKLMSEDDGVSKTGQTIGTLTYMSPEQLEGNADARSDIYSLGLTLYELLTWRRAFDETEHGALLRQKTIDQPPSPRSLDSSIPRDLETIVLKAMSRRPADRYQTAHELEEDLDRFLNDVPIKARRVSLVERAIRWSRRNQALAAASACVGLLSACVLALSLWGAARLQRALDGEKAERRRATATATLAEGALDTVFDRFGIEPMNGGERVGEPMLSSEAAGLLEDLLHYYEQLAARSSDRPDLILKTAAAQTTIGSLRERLGEYQEAVDAYRAAIVSYSKLPNETDQASTLAKLHNRIGGVLRFHGHDAAGRDAHCAAMILLEDLDSHGIEFRDGQNVDEKAAAARIEMARTHYFLGARVRPGMGPQSMPPAFAFAGPDANDDLAVPATDSRAVKSLEAAILILEEERSNRELRPAESSLLAHCLRERVHDNLVRRTPADTSLEGRSLDILRKLAREFPDRLDIRFDLMESLGEFSVFGNSLNPTVCAAAERRLQEAVGIGGQLNVLRPDVTRYALVNAHAHFKLSMVQACAAKELTRKLGDQKNKSAISHVSKAIDLMSALVEKFPQAEGFAAWKIFFLGKRAELLGLIDTEEAAREIAMAIDLLQPVRAHFEHGSIEQLTHWLNELSDELLD